MGAFSSNCLIALLLVLAVACGEVAKDIDLGSAGDARAEAGAVPDMAQDLITPLDGQPDAGDMMKPDTVSWCGNGALDPGEQCDDTQLGGKSCKDYQFAGGTLSCTSKCVFDTSKCYKCGDGNINTGEKCDGVNLYSETCSTQGFDGGTLACKLDCTDFDTAGCYKCGDGKKNGKEACDGTDLGNLDCAKVGFSGGTIKCDSTCKLDISQCTNCGNGKLDAGEECDGILSGSLTCKSKGFNGGSLSCNKKTCKLDTSGCYKCGDGKVDQGEECDGASLGSTCQQQQFTGGTLTCTKACKWDTSGCIKCGDSKVNGPDKCDGKALTGQSCKTQGYYSGTLVCKADCSGFDIAGCTNCGDGKLDGGEKCDGSALGTATCKTRGFFAGTLKCNASCAFDVSGCTSVGCGNGKLDSGENCEGANLDGKSCKDLGFGGGTLSCFSNNCTFDISKCYKCGDATINKGEICDGKNLAGKSCNGISPFHSGTLSCKADCKAIDTSGCNKCGDATINGTEKCDGTQMGSATCAGQGFVGGVLGCTSTCIYNTAGCYKCGDGKVNGTETCDGKAVGGKACKDFSPFHSGVLNCKQDCSGYDTTSCNKCGDGVIGGTEQCDGIQLGGKQCKNLSGFDHGTLACSATCTFVTSGCSNCSDGKLNGDEKLKDCGGSCAACKVSDNIYADFKKGTLSESGAKIYVSSKGNVQLTDRLDLNNDGDLDLVVSNYGTSTTSVPSYIYWGSAKGLSNLSRQILPTYGAKASDSGDYNDDGYPDVVFANNEKDGYKTNSFVYWGSKTGFDKSKHTDLPTLGAQGVTSADLNADGYLDLIFSNYYDGITRACNSYVYWGGNSGFAASLKTELPTSAGHSASVADLNKDGYLDLVFSNAKNDSHSYNIKSYVYWGSAAGYATGKRTELPTTGSNDNSVADMNKDGYLDIVFSTNDNSTSCPYVNSPIYLGSATGYSAANKTSIYSYQNVSVTIADLEKDGYLDLLFANPKQCHGYSSLFLGSASGLAASPNSLPSSIAFGSMIADYSGDGALDIAILNRNGGKTYVYENKSGIFSTSYRTSLDSIGASHGHKTDPGSVYDRKPLQTFTSRAHDTTVASPTYDTLKWTARVPKNTKLRFQLRSAASAAGLANAKWYGPTSTADYYTVTPSTSPHLTTNSTGTFTINSIHKGQRYIQYRSTLEHNFGNTPVLDGVVLEFK